MTTEELKAKVQADNRKLSEALAPLYVGRFCPILKDDCKGPVCMLYLPMTGASGKVEGGACSIPVLANVAGPIADGLMQLASSSLNNAPRVLSGPGAKL